MVDGGVVPGMASSMLTTIPSASFTEQKAPVRSFHKIALITCR